MLKISFGKNNENGADAMQIEVAEVLSPLDMLRALKKACPDLWQQVHLEVVVPAGPVNRILGANGSAHT